MKRAIQVVCMAVIVAVLGRSAMAKVEIETVPIGNPGNVADSTGYGAVNYEYNIGKYEVTAGQYTEFLNAVASDDKFGLYHLGMWSTESCKIQRNGNSGNFTYSVAADRANRPVNWVSFWDACRFVNWLHNGQPSGGQDLTTTEDGAYLLNGVMNPSNESISRKPDAKVWIPSEDEWYKAAYYKGGGTDTGYWDYPTQTDTVPSAEPPPGTDAANGSANYGNGLVPIYYTTEVGAYDAKPSASAYGTFDQGGNVWEWSETIYSSTYRSSRGGSYNSDTAYYLRSIHHAIPTPAYEGNDRGIRIAEVPEPATLSMLALGGLAVLRRRRRETTKP